MRTTGFAESIRLSTYDTLAALPADARALLAAAGRDEFALGDAWLANVVANGLPDGSRACFVVAAAKGRTVAVIPMRLDRGALASLTTPYTCLYAPVLDQSVSDNDARLVFAAFGRFCRSWPVVRVDALPAEWPRHRAFTDGLRRARLVPLAFEHFGNWYERVQGVDWPAYLEARPGELRQTIRRRLRRAEADPSWALTITDGLDGLDEARAAFEAVYASSWKKPEPFPRFNAGLIRAAALAGLLRLGVVRMAGKPVATQLWVVERHGRATVHKLAHDEAFRAESPGTVLAAQMIRSLLEQDRVTELDYGRGDDAYKKMWTRDRRVRVGYLIVNPVHPVGAMALARHAAGAAWRAVR